MKDLLDAYFQARTWYEKAQTTDCGMDSMYNQGRLVVKKFLDAFEATYCRPQVPQLPMVPWIPWPIDHGSGAPVPPYGPEITCGPRAP